MRETITLILLTLLILSSCERVKDSGGKIIERTVNESKKTIKKIWTKTINKAFDELTTTKKTNLNLEFQYPDTIKVEDINEIKIELPAGFYYTFLEYKSEKEIIFKFIENLPTKYKEISDSAFQLTDEAKLLEILLLIKKDYPKIKPKVNFFYEIKDKNNLEYYKCNRYPNSHYLIIDKNNDLIYHHFERYLD